MPTAFEIAQQHAGFALLHDRALLRIAGADATRWLNGMVTNSAQALAPGEGNYNFLLNAQGRIQGDGLLFRLPEGGDPVFLLVTEQGQIATIQAHLDRFIIMDDVELTPAHEDEVTLFVTGPAAADQLRALGIPVPDPLHLLGSESPEGTALVLAPGSAHRPAFEVRAKEGLVSEFASALRARGVAELDSHALEALRVLDGRPRVGVDIRDRELPQETGQAQALHFAKGCYLGQEIVERIRSRGQVHRVLIPLVLTGEPPESLPASLESNGKAVGELTSAISVPGNGEHTMLALGYVRREALETKAALSYPGGTARVRGAGQLG